MKSHEISRFSRSYFRIIPWDFFAESEFWHGRFYKKNHRKWVLARVGYNKIHKNFCGKNKKIPWESQVFQSPKNPEYTVPKILPTISMTSHPRKHSLSGSKDWAFFPTNPPPPPFLQEEENILSRGPKTYPIKKYLTQKLQEKGKSRH